MLKRIEGWLERAEQFDQDILDVMPDGYFDYFASFDVEKYTNPLGVVDFDRIPELDRVAYEWSLARESATELIQHLQNLRAAIEKRLERKGHPVGTCDAAGKPESGTHKGDAPES